MRGSWEQNFRTKDGRQEALAGCSRSSETRPGTVDRRQGSDRPRTACTDEETDQVNDMFLSQEDQPELTAQSVKYHWRQAFLSHLLSASYERILQLKCFKRRRAQELTDANCTACKLLLKKFFQCTVDFIFFTDEKVFTVAAAVNELWKSVDFTELKLIK